MSAAAPLVLTEPPPRDLAQQWAARLAIPDIYAAPTERDEARLLSWCRDLFARDRPEAIERAPARLRPVLAEFFYGQLLAARLDLRVCDATALAKLAGIPS